PRQPALHTIETNVPREGSAPTWGGLHAFDASTGQSLWSVELGLDEETPLWLPPFHPVITHGKAWVAGVRELEGEDVPTAGRCELVGYDVRSGEVTFARAVGSSETATPFWLDLPRHLVMRQLLARTLRRMVTGVELWNGNR